MRILNNLEQDICRRILKDKDGYNAIPNLIDNKLGEILISVEKENKKVEIIFPVRIISLNDIDTNLIIDRINEVSILIVTVCNLIALLEKEGYIMTFNQATVPTKKSIFGQGVGNMPNQVSHSLSDEVIKDLLIAYVDKKIIVTLEFERFCKKGFVARDEQRFTRQITLAYCAFGVALIVAILNVSTKFSHGTTINQQQIDTLTKSLDKIRIHLDTLNKNVVYNRSIQTKKATLIPKIKQKK